LKTIIKLLIVVAVLNACFQGARATWGYYQFKDGAQQAILFAGDASIGQLQQEIFRRGTELEVPVELQNILVTQEGPRTTADVAYTQLVEFFPRYEYPVKYSFKVDALAVNPRAPRLGSGQAEERAGLPRVGVAVRCQLISLRSNPLRVLRILHSPHVRVDVHGRAA
jgi:hypothetical protein